MVQALRSCALSALLMLPSIGLAQKVEADYDHNADFSRYKTYSWVKVGNNEQQVNQLVEQRIMAAIEETLAKKGLHRVDSGGDLLVDYQVAVKNQVQLNTYNTGGGPGWGWGPGWGYGYGAGGISTTTTSTIPVGTLVIDLMDPAAKQLVFRGTATDTLSDKPEKNTKKIQKAVTKIFDKYPPKMKVKTGP